MILPEVATPKGRSPEGVATEGKISHMTEGLIRAARPTQLCRIALQTRPTSQTTNFFTRYSWIVCSDHHKQLFVWSELSSFEMKVFKYSQGSSNVSTSNMTDSE